MKKILIFINSLSCGGAERSVVSLSSYLAEKGYKVSVVTLYTDTNDFLTLDSRIERHHLNLSRENRNGILENMKICLDLRNVIKKVRPDVLLAMQTGGGILSIFASVGLPFRLVVSERNFPGRKKKSVLLTVLRKYFYRYANVVVAQTHLTRKWLDKHTNAREISVIPNAVRWPLVTVPPVLLPENYIDKTERLILAAGRLSEQKGFDLLIEAFAISSASFPDWKMVILGDNARGGVQAQQRDLLERLISQKRLNGRVFLPGRAGNIPDWYARADVFVLSSRYEGFPNVLLEAMASGCPCVAFDCDTGPREIIEHEKNGLMVPPESLSALAQTLERIMHDEGLRNRLSKEAGNVVELFSEQKIMKKWEEVLCLG